MGLLMGAGYLWDRKAAQNNLQYNPAKWTNNNHRKEAGCDNGAPPKPVMLEPKLVELDEEPTENLTGKKYISYNLRSYFLTEPEQPTRCPECGGGLSRSSISPTTALNRSLKRAIIPLYEYSYLFVCSGCQWWLIRERWTECEVGDGCIDDVVVRKKISDPSPDPTQDDDQPWLAAIADPDLYNNQYRLPEKIVAVFLASKPVSPDDNHPS